jgi:hypothetical protein
MTLAIAHREGKLMVIDAIREIIGDFILQFVVGLDRMPLINF